MIPTPRLLYFDHWPHPVALEMLAERPHLDVCGMRLDQPQDVLWEALGRAHLYQIKSTRSELPRPFWAHADLLQRCPDLLAVSTTGSGFDTVDLAACTEAGVLAVNQAGSNKEAVAEHTLGMMLALSKRMLEADRAIRTVPGLNRDTLIGHDIRGRTLGIIGLGHIGTRLTELVRGLFSMQVVAYDPYLTDAQFETRGATPVPLDELFRSSDFVSVHCPRTAETEHMVTAESFRTMQPHAYFITTARGGIHDETALVDALREGRIAGAGVDVWDEEPPPLDHPLMAFDNVILNPHIAGVTVESRRELAAGGVRQLDTIISGARPPRLLNPGAWEAYAVRFERVLGRPPGESA